MSFWDFLAEFTYRRTVIGAVIVGIAAGVLGCQLYLRRQSMLADVIGHSSVAGVMGSFLAATSLSLNGRSILAIVCGAVISGLLSAAFCNWITRSSRVKEDAAMAVSLAMFYGGGMILLHLIQHSTLPNKGGIDALMFGNVSTLTSADNYTLGIISLLVVVLSILFFRPFQTILFDPQLAQLTFSPRRASALSLFQMLLIVIAVVLGIKAVGLILIIAFAIFPATAARQWTRSLAFMMVLAALFGASGGVIGSWIGVSAGKVPTGPAIVLVLSAIVAISLILSPRRGLLSRGLRTRRSRRLMEEEV